MPTLPPTVHERLAECNTRIFVNGLAPGADVQLDVGGNTFNHTAGSGGHNFLVPSEIVTAGTEVRARQDAGGGFSNWSPIVVVEPVALPPQAAPRLPDVVGACSHCVWVNGLVPGCDVELRVGGDVVGTGVANRHGSGCFPTALKMMQEVGTLLRAQMIVCEQPSPEASVALAMEPSTLPKPVVGSPLFGCQRVVPLSNMHRGARVRLETDTGTDLGSFCSCWYAVNVHIGPNLVAGESVRAQAYWAGERRCRSTGDWGEWEPVVPPDERIKPEIHPPLIDGDEYIRVGNQIDGAELTIRVRPDETQAPEDFGPRPASAEEEIALAAPLAEGNVVTVVQTLCTVVQESDPVTVLPRPPMVHAPVVVPPLYACGAAVQVSNLHPGALVRVYQDGVPIGLRWAGPESSVSVPATPGLVAGGKVTARQWVGGVESPLSDPPIEVQTLSEMLSPLILPPVALGDTTVWVSRVAPGAQITIRSGGAAIGETDAAEPIVRVPVVPVTGPIVATATLCERSSSSDPMEPIRDPCAAGSFEKIHEDFRDYGSWDVPGTLDSEAFTSPIEGLLYFPAGGRGRVNSDAVDLPLVVIAHGQWIEDEFDGNVEIFYDPALDEMVPVDSFKGYDYLAKHLASWGMVVFSLRLDVVNRRTLGAFSSDAQPHQYARAEIILQALDRLLNDNDLKDHIDAERIGLVGHSMGGEGVVVAQHLNHSEGRGFGIKGVVSIAPTFWRPEVRLRGTKYMQLLGSMDQLLGGLPRVTAPHDADAFRGVFSGFRIYDRAWRPKTHFWIHGARHNPFNRRWIVAGDDWENGFASDDRVLPNAVHERIAKCLINAFFQDALADWTVYGGYMQGTVLPRSLSGLEIFTQHSSDLNRLAVDNYGDLDEQVPLPAAPLAKTSNSLGQSVDVDHDGGLAKWEDLDHIGLDHSPHETQGVALSWDAPNVEYVSETGSVARNDGDVVSVRMAQFYEDAKRNPAEQPVDLFATVSDGGEEATVRLGAVAQVPYPSDAHERFSVLRTIRLPLSAFRAANPLLDLGTIKSVRLRLIGRATGHILADDLEISR